MMALEEKELKIFLKYFLIHDDTSHALDAESSQHCDCLPALRSQAAHNYHHTEAWNLELITTIAMPPNTNHKTYSFTSTRGSLPKWLCIYRAKLCIYIILSFV